MKNKKNIKKAQSGIIVTVLLVFIAIAVFIILAVWVTSFIKNMLFEAELGSIRADISIAPANTFYNDNALTGCPFLGGCINRSLTYVSIHRGSEIAPLVGINFIFNKGDRTIVYRNVHVPAQIETKIYAFPLINEDKPDSVSIAPIVLFRGKERILNIVDTFEINTFSKIIAKSDLDLCSIGVNSFNNNLPPVIPGIVGVNC